MSVISNPAAFVGAAPVVFPNRKRWTRDEYYRLGEQGWFQDQRVELIDGEIVLLSPQSPQHAGGSDRVREILQSIFGNGYWLRHQVPLSHGSFSEPESDVSVVRGSRNDYEEHHPTTALLIVEVSRSSLRFDKQTKQHLYASMGVPDYWVLDLVNRQLVVHRDPMPDASALFGYLYASIITLNDADVVAPLEKPQASISVSNMLPPKK